ncbi:hypothetical protein CPB83DRAFT_758120, partial [Crepidotus variabilis]
MRERLAGPLPKARRPFDQNWPKHDLGGMNTACTHCHALHWKAERLSKSSNINPKFGMCCTEGKIQLPPLDPAPHDLLNFYTSQDPVGKNFREHIRSYNNALAMTSVGCSVDRTVNAGGGPYIFKIHGKLLHHCGSLIPAEGENPVFAQLYIYDGQEALNYRLGHPANKDLLPETLRKLQGIIHQSHPGVQMFKQALDLTRNMEPGQQCRIALRFDEKTDRRRYNLPTTAAANEIAVILPGNGEQPTATRDIILHRLNGGGQQQISELHPMYLPLHYVLLFPSGQSGWH